MPDSPTCLTCSHVFQLQPDVPQPTSVEYDFPLDEGMDLAPLPLVPAICDAYELPPDEAGSSDDEGPVITGDRRASQVRTSCHYRAILAQQSESVEGIVQGVSLN